MHWMDRVGIRSTKRRTGSSAVNKPLPIPVTHLVREVLEDDRRMNARLEKDGAEPARAPSVGRKGYGLGMSEGRLLSMVTAYPNPTALARRLRDGSAFVVLRRLEAAGLVVRCTGPYRLTRRGRSELALNVR
jgi:hypothetical protein